MTETTLYYCYGCDTQINKSLLILIGEEYICESCIDDLDDKTGYCSIYCQLGQGCDESC